MLLTCDLCGSDLIVSKKKEAKQAGRMQARKPYQRKQEESGPSYPLVCDSCLAWSYATGIKPSDDSILIKIEEKDGTAGRGKGICATWDYGTTRTHAERNLIQIKRLREPGGDFLFGKGEKSGLIEACYQLGINQHRSAFCELNFFCHQHGRWEKIGNKSMFFICSIFSAQLESWRAKDKASAGIIASVIRAASNEKWNEAEAIALTRTEVSNYLFQNNFDAMKSEWIALFLR